MGRHVVDDMMNHSSFGSTLIVMILLVGALAFALPNIFLVSPFANASSPPSGLCTNVLNPAGSMNPYPVATGPDGYETVSVFLCPDMGMGVWNATATTVWFGDISIAAYIFPPDTYTNSSALWSSGSAASASLTLASGFTYYMWGGAQGDNRITQTYTKDINGDYTSVGHSATDSNSISSAVNAGGAVIAGVGLENSGDTSLSPSITTAQFVATGNSPPDSNLTMLFSVADTGSYGVVILTGGYYPLYHDYMVQVSGTINTSSTTTTSSTTSSTTTPGFTISVAMTPYFIDNSLWVNGSVVTYLEHQAFQSDKYYNLTALPYLAGTEQYFQYWTITNSSGTSMISVLSEYVFKFTDTTATAYIAVYANTPPVTTTTTVSCASPDAVGTQSECDVYVTGYTGSITGETVTLGSSGSGTWYPADHCNLYNFGSYSACGIFYTPSTTTGSPHVITATYPGDSFNNGSFGTSDITINEATTTTSTSTTMTTTSGSAGPLRLDGSGECDTGVTPASSCVLRLTTTYGPDLLIVLEEIISNSIIAQGSCSSYCPSSPMASGITFNLRASPLTYYWNKSGDFAEYYSVLTAPGPIVITCNLTGVHGFGCIAFAVYGTSGVSFATPAPSPFYTPTSGIGYCSGAWDYSFFPGTASCKLTTTGDEFVYGFGQSGSDSGGTPTITPAPGFASIQNTSVYWYWSTGGTTLPCPNYCAKGEAEYEIISSAGVNDIIFNMSSGYGEGYGHLGEQVLGDAIILNPTPTIIVTQVVACNFFQLQCWVYPIIWLGMFEGFFVAIAIGFDTSEKAFMYLILSGATVGSLIGVVMGIMTPMVPILLIVANIAYSLNLGDRIFNMASRRVSGEQKSKT